MDENINVPAHIGIIMDGNRRWAKEKGLASSIKTFSKRMKEKDYRIQLTGDIKGLSVSLQKDILKVEEQTKNNKGLTINFAINYGGRAEILNVSKIIAEKYKNGDISLENINEELFNKYVQTKNSPDPDLIIRTGGEQRLSGFLIWQSAYSEFYFTKVYWPDFSKEELKKAIIEYSNRKRNFGK